MFEYLNDASKTKFDYKQFKIDSNLQYFKPHSSKLEKTFSEEILIGFKKNMKSISPKFFYDKKGSDLFDQICLLPEYYQTKTEISILKEIQTEFTSYLDNSFRLVELGSGSSIKTRLILDIFAQIQEKTEYFPIDISDILAESSEQLLKDYESLQITGIIDTYEGGLEFLKTYDKKKNLIIFLGSSFGNFSNLKGYEFLQKINSTMKSDDLFLIGLDLVKDKIILEKAYNDSQGVTAEFNLNLLARINNELDGDFCLENFSHVATYNESNQRIEMYLKSLVNQSIVLSKPSFSLYLKKNELIHTEYSHKYTKEQISQLLKSTGFKIKKIWVDKNNYFSLTLASKN